MNLSDFKLFSFKKNDSDKDRAKAPVYRYKPSVKERLVNYLPWNFYVKEWWQIDSETKIEMCIVLQKNGAIQQTYAFRGHDIESFSKDYVAQVFEYFNSQIKRLGDGWMVSVEAQRFRMHDYPSADFDNIAGLLIDREREEEFKESGEHFDSCYYLTFVYKPEAEVKKKITRIFFREEEQELIIKDEIASFLKIVQNITSVLSGRMIIRPLTCKETVEYLHSTCSTKRFEMNIPSHFLFLDSFISDEKIDIGKTCRLGNSYIPIVEINDFPDFTYPAILNELNKLNVEYRWVSRFIPLSKEIALKELEKYQSGAAAGKKSSKKLADEMILGTSGSLENHSGEILQADAEQAQAEIGGGINGLGYYQSSVMVWDEDYYAARRKMNMVMQKIQDIGFGVKEEEFGAFDAFLGMLAGNTTANIRRPLITTGNYSHTLPFSAIWSGIEHNKFLNEITGIDKPLVTCATNYGANFYLNLNDGDVGHTLILGPTGAGKSTLLNLLAASALKYPDVQVFFMDYGLSALTLTLAVGGMYVNPAEDGVCFQPLKDVDDRSEFAWACEFIRSLLEIQGIEYNAQIDIAVESAMNALVVMPVEMRTITTFCLNLDYVDEKGHKILDDALAAYKIGGRFGNIFDGDHTSLNVARWVLFEMEYLMDLGKECTGPALLFIFHFLEKSFTGCLTFFIMDECWFGLENPAIMNKMKKYLLTLRKKNVFCIFATQNPSTVAHSPLATTMVQNCPTQIFLADPKATNKDLAMDYKMLGLTDDEIELIARGRKKRDYYLKSTAGTRFFQLALGPLQLALFRGKETKLKLKDGRIVKWYDFLQMIMEKRKNDEYARGYVNDILDIQQIPFRHYLEGLDWEDYLIWS